MTVSVIVLFVLMLAELIIFITLGIGYNNLAQSYLQSSGLNNYDTLLTYSSRTFAASSLQMSLSTLYMYEYNASMRKSNLISNPSTYMAYLVANGTLPNVKANSIAANFIAMSMGNDTLKAFNASVKAASLIGVSNVVINETAPVIYQSSPYNISVRYTENILLNESGTLLRYTIPVNASVSLNGTPDLFYAQQGVLRYINFGSSTTLATQIGSAGALNGTSDLFAYGTILDGQSDPACPTGLVSKQVIFATDNSQQINCDGTGFAALISYKSPSNAPGNYLPYILYPASSSYIENVIQTGQTALVYGPAMKTLDINALRNAVASGYYFASPFTPSYLDRIVGNFGNSSSNGMFTFTGYSRTAAYLNGFSSYISGNGVYSSNIANFEWINPMGYGFAGSSFNPIAAFEGSTANTGFYQLGITASGNLVVWNGASDYISTFIVPLYQWSFVGFGINDTAIVVYDNGNSQLFAVPSNPKPGAGSSDWILGAYPGTGNYLNVSLANVQVYNAILTTQQAYKLYQDGVEALPATGENIIGWYPLNGNANDYSGNGNNGAVSSVYFALLDNYNRDSIFIVPSAQPTFPLPGLLSCNNNQQCANATSPHLALADMPLEIGPGLAAGFSRNQQSVVVAQQFNGVPLVASNSFTFSVWLYGYGPATGGTIANNSNDANGNGFDMHFACGACSFYPAVMTVTPCCTYRVLWPSGVNSLPVNVWELVTGEYNSTTGIANVYVDNSLFATKALPAGLPTGQMLPLFIGASGHLGYNAAAFNGIISDAQLYNQSLSQNQISFLYSEGIGGAPILGKYLVAWWPLNGNANDRSGNGNNGVSYNATYTPVTGYSPVGSGTPTAVSGEWQALGFGPEPSKQSIWWNVTEWTPSSSSVDLLPYSSVSNSPLLPQGTTVEAYGGWYTIPTTRNFFLQYPGFADWAYGSATYDGEPYQLMQTVPFPAPFNGVNIDSVSCSSPYNSQGYTATANLTLSGTYEVIVDINDASQVFYRLAGTSTWTALFNSANSWKSQNPATYSNSLTLSKGTYQFAIDYMNVCGHSLSAFSIYYTD